MTRRSFLGGTSGAALALAGGPRVSGTTLRGADATPSGTPLTNAAGSGDVLSDEFVLTVGSRTLTPRCVSPKGDRLAAKPLLLLNLCADRETALKAQPYCVGVSWFLAHGHRAVSFDLPNHGQRVDQYGEGIQAWRNAWVAGEDRFSQFVEEASAVIGKCIERGYAEPGRVVVYGISRGGYLALRLLAADPRITAVAAIGPVTDWRDLTEFAAEKSQQELADTRLARWASALAGKRIFMVIGDSDRRVSTLSCCRFFLDLQEANAGLQGEASPVEFHCARMAEPGHTVDEVWRQRGAEFLLRASVGSDPP